MRQVDRVNSGGIVVAAILEQAHDAFPKANYPGDPETAIAKGQEIFSQLREITSSSEGHIDPATRKYIETKAAPLRNPAIDIGREILRQVNESGYYPAAGVVEDAVTALELVSYREAAAVGALTP
jgi:hypothetical protein